MELIYLIVEGTIYLLMLIIAFIVIPFLAGIFITIIRSPFVRREIKKDDLITVGVMGIIIRIVMSIYYGELFLFL